MIDVVGAVVDWVVELEKELTQFEAQERAAVVEAAAVEQDERETNP